MEERHNSKGQCGGGGNGEDEGGKRDRDIKEPPDSVTDLGIQALNVCGGNEGETTMKTTH